MQPGYLILDDGWQMTDTDREYSHLGVHAMEGPPKVLAEHPIACS